MIEYFDAPDIKQRITEIIELLRFNHIKSDNVLCVRSRGSQSKRILARIHGLGRIWQIAMSIEPIYIIEVISEQFDRLTPAGQERTLIHELLHIPHGFQGGFRHHKNYVTRENVDLWFKRFQEKKREISVYNKR
ncbi:metallopeptidase [Candidatus Bathyarchaeota archaeon]|nr:metallopeptidase [Candidatus Bathyarchaeota archaeon]